MGGGGGEEKRVLTQTLYDIHNDIHKLIWLFN